jgi:hypothetical protein
MMGPPRGKMMSWSRIFMRMRRPTAETLDEFLV